MSCASKGICYLDNLWLTLTGTDFAAAWAGMLVFDSLVFCMTLYKSIVLPRPNGANILDILMRDGELLACTVILLLSGSNKYTRRNLLRVSHTFLAFRPCSKSMCAQGNGGVQFG